MKKKADLTGLDARMANWLCDYIAKNRLLPVGKRFTLVLEVEHHKTTHLYNGKQKIVRADLVATGESMTEMDWNIILRLPILRKPEANTLQFKWKGFLEKMKSGEGPQEMPYQHTIQLNHMFEGNGLIYHLFKVSGSTTSRRRGPLKFMVYKKY